MANIKYSELLDEVLPNLAADPSDPVTENAIKRAVIEFCEKSWIWQYLPDNLDVTAGEAAIDLEPLPGSDIAAVMAAALDGNPLDAKSLDWLNANVPRWRTDRTTPRYYTQVDTEQLILAGVPDASSTGGLALTLALQPSHNATGFPKWIFNQHVYALADGAMAKLMLMPAKPWTDVVNGQDRRAKFDAAIANARAAVVAGLGRAALRVAAHH